MSSTNAPFGLRLAFHPAGDPRIASLKDGILSTYGTAIYTGTPIKRDTNGTIIPVGTGADVCIGIFCGCQYTTTDGRRIISAYWPASTAYVAGSMIAQYEMIDGNAIYEGQADGSVAQTANGEGINLVDASTGSAYTGLSSQALNHTTTGATAATFQIVDVAPYPDNDWGDTYTIVRVKISTFQGQVA
jgi:hypothetical protein